MIKFYRGLYSSYNYDKTTKTGKHLDCIYFATDVGKILMNGIEFASSTVDTSKFNTAIKGVTISGNVLTFIPVEGSSFTVTIPTATSTANGVMSSTDKSKLDGIASGALVNQNAFSNVKVGDTTVAADSVTDILTLAAGSNVTLTADTTTDTITIAAKDTTYSAATTSAAGLMSAADKSKLDGIDANANNYSLPTASSTTLGGVKTGSNITNTSGTISLTKDNITAALGYTPPTQDTDTHYTTGLKVGAASTAISNAVASNGSVYLNVLDNSTVRDSHLIKGTGATTVTSDANGVITINSTDNNTTYSAGTGISLSGTTFNNSGVRSIASGSSNGTISVNTNGTTANVAVAGLGSAAYTDSSSYASASHTHSYLPLSGGTLTGTTTILTGGMWVLGGSEAGGDNTRMSLDKGMPNGLAYNTSKRGTRIYSNAIALADPINGNSNNDAGWIRHLEETANSGVLEIATGDDGNESIVVRLYNTSSTISREVLLLNGSGNTSFPGTVTATTFSGALSGTATKATLDSGGLLINTTYIKGLSVSGKTITYTKGDGITGTLTTLDTTYTASNGVRLSGTTFYNSGVRAIATGSASGTISVNTDGTTTDVAVKGLGTAAYTASSAYATANHTHTGAQVTMSGYSALSGGYVTASDTVNTAINKIEDLLLWYELN